ncbi:MAG: hypothetical protein ACLRRK_04990 [Parasutterella sp.]
MKIRNVAFIAALIGWIALAVYYVTPSESAVAKKLKPHQRRSAKL